MVVLKTAADSKALLRAAQRVFASALESLESGASPATPNQHISLGASYELVC